MTRTRAVAALLVGSMALAGCAADADAPPASSMTGWVVPGASSDATAALHALPVESFSGDVVSRAADDVIPPTNRWYSGLVFGDEPQRIFPFPLALQVRTDSFGMTLPGVVAGPTTIATDSAAGIVVGVPADAIEVVRTDPVSVTTRYTLAGAAVGDLTTAQGWPVVGFTAAQEVVLAVEADLAEAAAHTWSATIDGQEYAVLAPEGAVEGGRLTLPAGATAQWFAVPADSDVGSWADALGEPIDAVTTTYANDDDLVSTRLVYEGTDATIIVPFPGHEPDAACDLGTFETPYGSAAACAATSSTWSVPRLSARGSYDLQGIDAETRARLLAQLEVDLATAGDIPPDTYFGGKALARLGALLSLARALGDDALADTAADRLALELEPWTDPDACDVGGDRCFVYDEGLRLVTGGAPSFGSEEGNDHHFHYGYFLAAAAALAEARPQLIDALAPVMDTLAADIAAGASDGALPALRVFDPYRGHSWASGLSPFADGNNQESTSEAVAAWNGLALWATARGDARLVGTAEWMLSAEAAAARALWLEPADLPEGYTHGMVSLSWGAKRDYATWFSAEPSAILGIQALPIGPISLDYLASDPDRVAQNVAEAGGDAGFGGPLGEYVLQYSALGGPEALDHADEVAARLDPAALDDGTSLSAILAWLAAVRLAGAKN